MGTGVEVAVGSGTGVSVGSKVGVPVGSGVLVGSVVGVFVGSGIGSSVGSGVNVAVGSGVGVSVGSGVAVPVGDGAAVATGVFVTTSVGETPSVAAVVGVSDDDWFLSLRLDIITSKTIPAMTSIADPRMIRIRLFIYTILPETQSIISVLSLKKPLGSFYKVSVSIAIIELDFLSAMRMMGHP